MAPKVQKRCGDKPQCSPPLNDIQRSKDCGGASICQECQFLPQEHFRKLIHACIICCLDSGCSAWFLGHSSHTPHQEKSHSLERLYRHIRDAKSWGFMSSSVLLFFSSFLSTLFWPRTLWRMETDQGAWNRNLQLSRSSSLQ